ncbi:aldehyde dehydrogenase [Ceratocystis lukuohia]|uniref:Aldehyde dehydrogenase n=1 Tax=Ceratocystis lukuohia TaxID=2019550 RepID=A0ABR4MKH3_9PEZI
MEHTVPFVINGAETVAASTFPVTSPITSQHAHQCSSASVSDALSAVASAEKALAAWKRTTARERRDILLKAAAIMESRSEEITAYMKAEIGAAASWAQLNLNIATDIIKDVAGRVATIQGSIPGTQSADVGGLVLKEPLGVVLAIAPWNAPVILGTRAVVFPIAAGNTVVFKGSEASPRTHWAIVSCLLEAGLPAGVLNFIAATPANASAVTSSIISHPSVKKINFTGSSAIGRIIGRIAGENLKPVLLELGGKAPAIVWNDADLDVAAAQCALGAFANAGQICMCTERILVHTDVRAAFEAKLAACVEQFFPTADEAPILATAGGVTKNRALVADAVAKGARVLVGSADTEESSATRMRPIVLADVTTDMEIYHTESFGPSVSLIGVDSEEEAIRIANDTEYGLSSAVFTSDLRRGLRFARAIEAGAVHINHMSVHDESVLPHGGCKSSGFGRFNASYGLDEWVRTKTVTYNID